VLTEVPIQQNVLRCRPTNTGELFDRRGKRERRKAVKVEVQVTHGVGNSGRILKLFRRKRWRIPGGQLVLILRGVS
jgi:hypothetical protein